MRNPTESINRRMKAAAGRLISMPGFIEARDKLRNRWHKLPHEIRPPLPLRRPFVCPSGTNLQLKRAPKIVAEFMSEFDAFCDEWHLLGMTSWILPDVWGPNWAPGLGSDEALRRGDATLSTPWHFAPVPADDLGRAVLAEHRRQAEERGIEDEDRWETYAELLAVHYWETVLGGRYSPDERIRGFMTRLEEVLAEMLDLTLPRVQKLRKWLKALQTGKLTSLRGQR